MATPRLRLRGSLLLLPLLLSCRSALAARGMKNEDSANAWVSGPPPQENPQDLHSWVTHGKSLLNQRWAPDETALNATSAASLALAWRFPTAGDVSATPAVYRGIVYAPDWAGFLYAIDQAKGSLVWSRNISDYGFPAETFSRTTPAVAVATPDGSLKEDLLILGTDIPAAIFAVSAATGCLVWSTLVDAHPKAKITGGGTVYAGAFFAGVSSEEELASLNPAYPCCAFIGSVVKLDAASGALLWQTYTLPQRTEDPYAGGAVWAATPSIDAELGLVYTGVGNMYITPKSVLQCQEAQGNRTVYPDPCVEEGNHFDSVIALDVGTGAYRWSRSFNPTDAYTLACVAPLGTPPRVNCPPNNGPDYDFGMSPLLLRIPNLGNSNATDPASAFLDVAIIGQKSGILFALERASGALVWATQAGPAGTLGGAAWGLATDGERVYAGIINDGRRPLVLAPSDKVVPTGAWVALQAATGRVLWSTPNLNPRPSLAMLPSAAPGVVFVTSADAQGHVYGLSAASGEVLFAFSPGVSVYGGVSIANGCIFFGVGYGSIPVFSNFIGTIGGGPQSIYSFCV